MSPNVRYTGACGRRRQSTSPWMVFRAASASTGPFRPSVAGLLPSDEGRKKTSRRTRAQNISRLCQAKRKNRAGGKPRKAQDHAAK